VRGEVREIGGGEEGEGRRGRGEGIGGGEEDGGIGTQGVGFQDWNVGECVAQMNSPEYPLRPRL